MFRTVLAVAFSFYFSFAFAQDDSFVVSEDSVYGFSQINELINTYQFSKAVEALEGYLLEHPDDKSALLKLAGCHSNLGNLANAKKTYQEILQLDSSDVVASNRLATIYIKEKAYKPAKICYERLIRNDSSNSYYYKKLAEVETKLNKIDTAISLYQLSLVYNPKDLESIIALSQIYLDLLEDEPKLEDAYANTLSKGFKLDSLNRSLLEIKARHDFKAKEYAATVETLDLFFKYHQDTLFYYAGMAGTCQFNLGNLEKAEWWFQHIIDKKEDTEITHYYLGMTYDKMEAYGKAIEHFEKAIKMGISENIFNYYVSLGGACENNNNLGGAIKAYQEAYKYSNQSILLYKLARNYDAYYKDKRPAIDYYNKFLDRSQQENPLTDYSTHRISELKGYLHEIDSLD